MTGGKISMRDSDRKKDTKCEEKQGGEGFRREEEMTRGEILHFRERKRKIGR